MAVDITFMPKNILYTPKKKLDFLTQLDNKFTNTDIKKINDGFQYDAYLC